MANVRIEQEKIDELQLNLVRSHAVGVGDEISEAETRAIMLLRANALATGYCGCRAQLADTLAEMINARVHPVIPSQGSVGASGDLAPLAHLALVMVGEGEAIYDGKRVSGAEAMRRAGVAPIALAAKEGLSLINGTQFMTAVGVLALLRAEAACKLADVAGAMTLEALKGSVKPFEERIHRTRNHPGQMSVAENFRRLCADSEIGMSHADCAKIQDAYSLRCIPQVHGAVRDAIVYTRRCLETEINAATDNPLVFVEDESVVSAGNFHGQPVAVAMDFLGIALAELGAISERRIEKLINPALSELPPFLAKDSGLHSGMMLVQVTAASLVSENKVLSHPASVDSIPTSADKEDHVSMGAHAAVKAARILENLEWVFACEFLCAAQGLEFHEGRRPGAGAEAGYRAVRSVSAPAEGDHAFGEDLKKIKTIVSDGSLLAAVERTIGALT
ncbi:MAG: histidine ammonia-lyase [Deltaproteobacteria bacterium]|nr:histidine ammonia-lyase [Deltaproteobacteria bacterium]